MTKSSAPDQNNAAASDASFTVDTSVTRQQLIDTHFQGLDDPDKEFDNVLVAMGLKAGGKKFKGQTAYSITVCRGWINSGEIDSYEKLTERWADSKDDIALQFTKMSSAMTPTGEPGGLTTSDSQNGISVPSPAMALAEPAQASYAAGEEVMGMAAQRIAQNTELAQQVFDAAFFEGMKSGMSKMEFQTKKPSPPLITENQIQEILQGLGRDSNPQTD